MAAGAGSDKVSIRDVGRRGRVPPRARQANVAFFIAASGARESGHRLSEMCVARVGHQEGAYKCIVRAPPGGTASARLSMLGGGRRILHTWGFLFCASSPQLVFCAVRHATPQAPPTRPLPQLPDARSLAGRRERGRVCKLPSRFSSSNSVSVDNRRGSLPFLFLAWSAPAAWASRATRSA